MRARGVPEGEALLQCSRAFQEKFGKLCMQAVLARDQRAIQLIRDHRSDAIFALRLLGALDPPWLRWKRGDEPRVASQLASNLDETRSNREYSLRARLVRTQTKQDYTTSRMSPRELALPDVDHVLSAADVARLRNGETLVIDPTPALLPAAGFAAALTELLEIVRRRRGVTESNNPCNLGSFHGMLPCRPSDSASDGLGVHTRTLLRRLSALPALVERHGWKRPLMLPSMVQLGYYPGGSGARYRPHLDRWADEVDNRRELTFLVYVNVGWQPRDGGCLRLHPDNNNPGTDTVDVEPLAGRVVVFESGKQMHEVRECAAGVERIALTLWVEYADAWQQPEAGMLPALQH